MTPADIAEKLFKYQTAARARGAYTDCARPSEDEVADAIAEACGAALQERDAEHEIALKKARTDGIREAAALLDRDVEYLRMGGAPWTFFEQIRLRADRIRALLEEAGK